MRSKALALGLPALRPGRVPRISTVFDEFLPGAERGVWLLLCVPSNQDEVRHTGDPTQGQTHGSVVNLKWLFLYYRQGN